MEKGIAPQPDSAILPLQDAPQHLNERTNIFAAPHKSTIFLEDKHPRYKWLVLLASFFSFAFAFLVVGVWGVYQEHFLNVAFKGQILPSQISFVGGINATFCFSFILLYGPIIRRWGEQVLLYTGAILMPTGLLLASFSTAPWHLFLTMGLLASLGSSLLIAGDFSLVGKYWDKRRGFALGFMSAGSGFGGLAFAPITRLMIENLGWGWSLRIYSFAGYAVLLICAFIMKPFEPPLGHFGHEAGSDDGASGTARNSLWHSVRQTFKLLKNKKMLVVCIMAIFLAATYRIPFFYVPSYAVYIGLTPADGALFLGLMNGFSAAARILFGTVSDYTGVANGFIVALFISMVSVFFIWIFSTTYAALLAFSIIYGLGSGGDVGLVVILVRNLVGIHEYADALGLMYSFQIVTSLAGPSIFGALVGIPRPDGTKGPYYLPAQLFGGSMWFITLCCAIFIRFLISRYPTARV